MQPRTPPRQAPRWINDHGICAVPARYSHHAKQSDGQLSLPAPDARAHRSSGMPTRRGRNLALGHGLVYLHLAVTQNHPAIGSGIGQDQWLRHVPQGDSASPVRRPHPQQRQVTRARMYAGEPLLDGTADWRDLSTVDSAVTQRNPPASSPERSAWVLLPDTVSCTRRWR